MGRLENLGLGPYDVPPQALQTAWDFDRGDEGWNNTMDLTEVKTAGFDVHDLGKDVPTERIVEAVREMEPTIVGLSSLLTTTVPEQRVVIQALEAAGLRGRVKVMVGGAPVTEDWASEIGADGFAPNAPEAVKVALQLAGSERPTGD